MYKIRRKNNIVLYENDVPINIITIFSGEIFLIYDTDRDDPNKILIFSTETHFLYSEKNQAWFVTGHSNHFQVILNNYIQ